MTFQNLKKNFLSLSKIIVFEKSHVFFYNIFNHENIHFDAFQMIFFDVKSILFENLSMIDMKTFISFEFEGKNTIKFINIVWNDKTIVLIELNSSWKICRFVWFSLQILQNLIYRRNFLFTCRMKKFLNRT